MRREKKIEYTARIACSWRNLIYNTNYKDTTYDYLLKVMASMYPKVKLSFINRVYLDVIKTDPIYGMWNTQTNIMLCYETEYKKYGVYYTDCYTNEEYKELVGKYSSRRMAERVASILNENYDDSYIVEQL